MVVTPSPDGDVGVVEVCVRLTNGMEFLLRGGELVELLVMVKKLLV